MYHVVNYTEITNSTCRDEWEVWVERLAVGHQNSNSVPNKTNQPPRVRQPDGRQIFHP